MAAVRSGRAFAADLEAAAGRPAGLRTEGTVVAATGTGDRAELDTLARHLARLGRAVERLTGRELRRLEPAIGPGRARRAVACPVTSPSTTGRCSPRCGPPPSGRA